MENTHKFKAMAKNDSVIADTPRQAAQLFFQTFPNRRKCLVLAGKQNGPCFTVEYDPQKWPASYKDVTKATAGSLPDVKA
jgi:hypothetical protein